MNVGADAHIGPADCTVFTEVYGEFVTSQGADVGIGPYNRVGTCMRIHRKIPVKSLLPAGGQSRPPLRIYGSKWFYSFLL